MLQIRPQRPLGQYNPYAPQGYNPYGQQAPGYVDPLLDAGLTAAGAVLAPSDPGASETFQLVRRVVAAPSFPSFSSTPTVSGGAPVPHKLSEINPALRAVAWVKENQALTGMLVLSVPVLAYLLGRSGKR